MPNAFRIVLTLAATTAVIVVNGLANALPINGQRTGEISDRFDVYFTPAGYVFSIWGLIYLSLIGFSIYQALPAGRRNARIAAISPGYWVASLANVAWILCWHYELFVASLFVMLVLLGALIFVYLQLNADPQDRSAGMRWCVRAPFSLYLGWITVATVANVTVVLDHLDWGGLGISAETWTAIVIAVAVAIGAAVAFTRRDWIFPLVLTWAFFGIYVKHRDIEIVAYGALLATVSVMLFAVVALIMGRVAARRNLTLA